jgi:hypothetical protein
MKVWAPQSLSALDKAERKVERCTSISMPSCALTCGIFELSLNSFIAEKNPALR